METISDDTLIYQLKMRSRGETNDPGLAKDAVPDFKRNDLRARASLNKGLHAIFISSFFLPHELILSALAAQGYIPNLA